MIIYKQISTIQLTGLFSQTLDNLPSNIKILDIIINNVNNYNYYSILYEYDTTDVWFPSSYEMYIIDIGVDNSSIDKAYVYVKTIGYDIIFIKKIISQEEARDMNINIILGS